MSAAHAITVVKRMY